MNDIDKVFIQRTDIKTKVLTFFVIICFIYCSGYFFTTRNPESVLYIIIIILLPMLIITFKSILNDRSLTKSSIIFFIFTYLYLSSCIVNFSLPTVKAFIIPYLMLTFGFCISYIIDFKKFSYYFLLTIKIISIISLITFIFRDVILSIFNLPSFSNINGVTYINGLVFGFYDFGANFNIRNIGVFWEPGLFSSFLILAIIFEIYFKSTKTSYINISIFIITILTTKSSAAYFLLIFVGVLLLYRSKYIRNFIPYLLFVIGGVVYFNYNKIINYLLSINYEIFSKFTEKTLTGMTRIGSPIINLGIFRDNPFFGVGFQNVDNIYINNMNNFSTVAQTSTNTYFLAVIGAGGILFSAIWVWGIFRIKRVSLIEKISIIVIIFFILNKEPHYKILFDYCFMFYLLNNDLNRKNI